MGFGLSDTAGIIVVLSSILISMTLHEAMHAYAATWLGDHTPKALGRLTLNPIKHIDPFLTILLPLVLFLAGAVPFGGAKPVPFNPNKVRYYEFGVAIVGIAGPLTNLFLAIISGVWLRFSVSVLDPVIVDIGLLFMIVNLSFFAFNMIPIPPLDGSRVLFALAPEPVQKFMRTIEQQGFFMTMILLFMLLPFIRPIVGGTVEILATFILGENPFA